jgi:hypothetical protein
MWMCLLCASVFADQIANPDAALLLLEEQVCGLHGRVY